MKIRRRKSLGRLGFAKERKLTTCATGFRVELFLDDAGKERKSTTCATGFRADLFLDEVGKERKLTTCATCAPRAYSNLTETSFETPTSSMVTPYSARAVSIVRLLWVMTMNCVSADIPTTFSVKRPMFASSSGASTSSSKQKGDGR